MADTVVRFQNLFEFLTTNAAQSNFTLSAVWFVCGFGILLSWNYFRSLLAEREEAALTENVRKVMESMAMYGGRLEPRRVVVLWCTDAVLVDNILLDLLRGAAWFPVIGSDCEMKPRPGKPPRIFMIQFSNRYGDCVLIRFPIRICEFSHVLMNVLTDPYLWKVGVGVYDDMQYLSENHPQLDIIPQGSFDLRYLAAEFGFKERGLKKLGRALLGVDTSDPRIDRGSWDAQELTAAQIRYAATDAYLGVRLFETFFELSLKKVDATIEITEEIKQQEISNFLHKWFDKKSQQYREDNGFANNMVYCCNWLLKLVSGRRDNDQ